MKREKQKYMWGFFASCWTNDILSESDKWGFIVSCHGVSILDQIILIIIFHILLP